MSTTFESNRPGGSQESQGPNGKMSEQFQELFDGVEDLLKRVSEVDSPEIQKIRAKARVALMLAKSAIADSATQVGKQARRAAGSTGDYVRRAAGSTDEYVHEYPWYALGAGAVLGFALGVIVSRSRD
jgi:ElaB/YqjD/DUF883 family membrane-anchored ribosome-binding protein